MRDGWPPAPLPSVVWGPCCEDDGPGLPALEVQPQAFRMISCYNPMLGRGDNRLHRSQHLAQLTWSSNCVALSCTYNTHMSDATASAVLPVLLRLSHLQLSHELASALHSWHRHTHSNDQTASQQQRLCQHFYEELISANSDATCFCELVLGRVAPFAHIPFTMRHKHILRTVDGNSRRLCRFDAVSLVCQTWTRQQPPSIYSSTQGRRTYTCFSTRVLPIADQPPY